VFYRCSLNEVRFKTASPKDPNTRAKSIKLLEENIEEKLHDTGFGNNLFYMTTKA
jgi:hypothetical protein